MDVHAALVGEGTRADERLAGAIAHVRRFVDEPRELGEVRPAVAAEHRVARKLQGQVRHHRDQIGIAAAFADAIDRALHLHRTGGDGGERVRHGEVAVVVAVDRQGTLAASSFERRSRFAEDTGDLVGQGAAVRVAADDPRGSRPGGGHDRLRRIVGIQFPAIEEVLRVVKHFAAGLGEVAHRVGDHGEVFLARDA